MTAPTRERSDGAPITVRWSPISSLVSPVGKNTNHLGRQKSPGYRWGGMRGEVIDRQLVTRP